MRRCAAIQTFFREPTRPVQVSFAEEAGPDEEKEAKHEDACFDAMSSAAAPADLTPTEFPLTGGLTVGEIVFCGGTGDSTKGLPRAWGRGDKVFGDSLRVAERLRSLSFCRTGESFVSAHAKFVRR